MIKKLLLKNFESHKKTSVTFSEGLNVIIGTSDSGKSGLIRALDWVLNNRPSGNAFIRNNAGVASAQVKLTHGGIKRVKGSKTNEYRLFTNDGMEVFRSFKGDVPEEVELVANMGSINWKKQFDSHFLLSLSPSAVARELNSTVGLEDIDSSIRSINRMHSETSMSLKFSKERVGELEESLKEYKNLDRVDKLLKKAEGLARERRGVLAKIKRLDWLSIQLDDWSQHSTQKKAVLKEAKRLLSGIEKLASDLDENEEKQDRLSWLRSEFKRELKTRKEARDRLRELHKQMPEICEACGRPI